MMTQENNYLITGLRSNIIRISMKEGEKDEEVDRFFCDPLPGFAFSFTVLPEKAKPVPMSKEDADKMMEEFMKMMDPWEK